MKIGMGLGLKNNVGNINSGPYVKNIIIVNPINPNIENWTIGDNLDILYEYFDANGDLPDYQNFEYKWFRADDADGTNEVEIFGLVEAPNQYPITIEDSEKFLRAELKAAALTGKLSGSWRSSERIQIPNLASYVYEDESLLFKSSAELDDYSDDWEAILLAHDQFIKTMKANNIWTKIREFLPFVGASSTPHSTYGKNPARTKVTWYGSPTHNASGVKGNGTNQYGDMNFNPVTEGMNADSAFIAAYVGFAGNVIETGGASRFYLGVSGGPGLVGLGWVSTGSVQGGWVAGGSTEKLPTNATNPTQVPGFVMIKKTSDVAKLLINGTLIEQKTQNNSYPNYSLFVLAYSNSGNPSSYANTAIIKFIIIGDDITDAEADIIHDAVLTYQTALGRA